MSHNDLIKSRTTLATRWGVDTSKLHTVDEYISSNKTDADYLNFLVRDFNGIMLDWCGPDYLTWEGGYTLLQILTGDWVTKEYPEYRGMPSKEYPYSLLVQGPDDGAFGKSEKTLDDVMGVMARLSKSTRNISYLYNAGFVYLD